MTARNHDLAGKVLGSPKATAAEDRLTSGARRNFEPSHVFASLLWIVVIHLLWAWEGVAFFFRAFGPAAKAPIGGEEGGAGMLTTIKASLLGSALMLLESCTARLRMCTVHNGEPELAGLS